MAPLPAPVTDQVLSAAGPKSVSVPAPPSKETGIEIAPIVKESLPAPLVIERLVTLASGRLVVTPSTVTVRSVVSASTEIVWASSERTIVQGAGAGGERPLAVFAFGSGAVRSALDGDVVAPELLVELVVVVPDPSDPPADDPEALVGTAPFALVGSCVVAEVSEPPEAVELTPLGSLDAGALTDGVSPDVVAVVEPESAVEVDGAEGAATLVVPAGSVTPGAAGAASDVAGAETEDELLVSVAPAAGSADAVGAGDAVAVGVNAVVTPPPPKSSPGAKAITSVPPGPDTEIGAGAVDEVTVCSPAASPAKAICTVPATATGPGAAGSTLVVDSLTATSTVPPGARTGVDPGESRSTPAARSTPTDTTTSIAAVEPNAPGSDL